MILKGPFNIKWGANIIEDVEAIELDYDANTEDYRDNAGVTHEIDKGRKVVARITLLANDIPSLAALLPQYHIPQGENSSQGYVVANPAGAIDVFPYVCSGEDIYNDLNIAACGAKEDVIRIVNTKTDIDGITVDGKLRKVVVKFVSEPIPGQAAVLFLKDEAIGQGNYLQLENGEYFQLENGEFLEL